MKYITLRTALLLLTTTTASWAEVDNILANEGKFKPTITLSDVYNEDVLTEREDGLTFYSVEVKSQAITIKIIANLDGVATGVIDGETAIGISVGNFDHVALLGEAEGYQEGDMKATFPLTKEMERANGETYDAPAGSVTYTWKDKQLKVTVTCSDVVAAGVADIAATDYAGIADAGTSVSFAGDALDVSIFFGDASGTRRAFLKGVSKTVTRKLGSDAAGTYEELDVVDVNVKGEADRDEPTVTSVFPAKPGSNRTINISGTAFDDHTLVALDAITVNGVPTAPAAVSDGDTGEGIWNWSVTGLPLVKGKNVVELRFSDEDGNVTKATKTYSPDGKGPVVKAFFPAKPGAGNKIDIIGTADDLSLVTLDSVTVNGVLATPASLSAGDTNVTIWNWSVGGLQLPVGRSVILLTFSDEEGNIAKVTKTYTIK